MTASSNLHMPRTAYLVADVVASGHFAEARSCARQTPRAIMRMAATDCTGILKALADPTRQQIVKAPLNRDLSVNTLNDKLGLSQYNTSSGCFAGLTKTSGTEPNFLRERSGRRRFFLPRDDTCAPFLNVRTSPAATNVTPPGAKKTFTPCHSVEGGP
jgi:hypothetical protein